MFKFYFCPGASSMAPHIALHEIGAPFESQPISLARHENRTPDYLALNPEGKVPLLLVDGAPLTEVAGILFYLARRFPESGLLPAGDPLAEAQADSWMSFIASTVHPARRQGIEKSKEVWAIAERKLAGRPWVLKDYSIADIHLFRLYWRFVGSGQPPADLFPGLSAHYRRMMARPAVKKTCEIEAAIGYHLPP
jgi:glutathione S-transferase